MNERIKELAEQAGLEFDDDLTLEPEPIYYATQTDIHKFAELIVKECADLVDDPEDHDDLYVSDGDMIKKHFGVDDDQA